VPERSSSILLLWLYSLIATCFVVGATAAFALGLGIVVAFVLGGILALLGWTLPLASKSTRVVRGLVSQIGPVPGGARRGAIYDPGTGLYSRWYLELRLREEGERSRRYSSSFALMAVRLTGVKLAALSTNDWIRTVQDAANVTTATIRVVDLVAVLGLGELAICLLNCGPSEAEIVRDRLTSKLGSRGEALIGAVAFPQDGLEPEALIELARKRAQSAATPPAPLGLRQLGAG